MASQGGTTTIRRIGMLATCALATVAASLSGCASMTSEQVLQAAQPKSPPVKTMTSFSSSLSCMDDLFYAYGIREIRITTTGIPDATGEISLGARDMLIAAVGRMSTRSRAFNFIDFEQVATPVGVVADSRLYSRMTTPLTPTYYIRGSISSYDESVGNDTFGIGVKVKGNSAGLNKDTTSSVVGLDMNIGEVQTSLIVPGVASSNRLVVSRQSTALDASYDVKIDGENVGGYLQGARTQAEGMQTGVRSMIELGAIEMLGKLARVPYWRCLSINQNDVKAAEKASVYFSSMTDDERVQFVQRSMLGLSLYKGPIDGRMNTALSEAVGQYQAKNGLVATGRIDSQLYASLLGNDIKLAGPGAPVTGSGSSYDALVQGKLFISMQDTNNFPTYRVGQPMQLNVRLNADAYLYCYYQDGAGTIARIFPNRFQAGPYVAGGKVTMVPEADHGFIIAFQQKGATERTACFASRKDIGRTLPASLQVDDLKPLPFKSMSDLEASLRSTAPDDLAISTLEFLVRAN